MKERCVEVAAVRMWHQVKEQAREVAKVANELAQSVRQWLERTVEGSEKGLAYAGGREAPKSLAQRLREAQEAKQHVHPKEPQREQQPEPMSLAERLRMAATGIDRRAAAERASELVQQGQKDRAFKQELATKEPPAKELPTRESERDNDFDL